MTTFKQNDADMKVIKCPVCDGRTWRDFTQREYWIRACEVCGHRTAEIEPTGEHVATTYDDGYFHGGGAGYRDYLSEARILTAHGHQYGSLMKRYAKPGRVLDVGAAAGFLLKGFVESGWSGEGIEPNPKMAQYARMQLGMNVAVGSLESYRRDAVFDLVSMIQVIAHFIDPRSALKVADAVTRPRGFWLVETWNRESLTARFFGKHWHEYSPPSVLQWFSPSGVSSLAAEFGFREVARGKPTKRISAGHAKSLVRYRLEGSYLSRPAASIFRLVPDGLSLPYPAEDLFWMVFQKV